MALTSYYFLLIWLVMVESVVISPFPLTAVIRFTRVFKISDDESWYFKKINIPAGNPSRVKQ
jgi:hypothetical protein